MYASFMKRQRYKSPGDLHWGNKTDKVKRSMIKQVDVTSKALGVMGTSYESLRCQCNKISMRP